ncbi:MAG: hypothetical protein JSW73_00495, partial [Candidatus Woesearchaeota archaeon]
RNIDTQAYTTHNLGMQKAHAMAVALNLKSPPTNYYPIDAKIESVDHVNGIVGDDDALIIDCFDNTESRGFVHGKNCLHVGFSPQYTAEMIWDETYSVPNDIPEDQDDICDMTEAIPFINFIVSLACMNVSQFLDNGDKVDMLVTNKVKIRYLRRGK